MQKRVGKNVSKVVAADRIQAIENSPMDIQYIFERISRTTVGRGTETEMFKKQFDRVLEGGMGLTIVLGQPGVGKSFFVEHAVNSLGGGATYVHGKFRQYDKSPLIAFSEIIEQMVRHILTLPAEALKSIKNDMNRKMSGGLGIILSVCPYAGIILGTHRAVNVENLEQLKYRVRKAVVQFLEIVSTALFPLILFIDDLQWADTLSAGIIEALCKEDGTANLHLVLACRQQEGQEEHLLLIKPLADPDSRIELGGLNYKEIEQYVGLIFGDNIEHKEHLVRILLGLTLGNPFNIDRILRLLIQNKAFIYSSTDDKWLLLYEKMEKLNLPADMEQLILRQINGLEKEEKELLFLISCSGNTTVPLLMALTDIKSGLLDFRLDRLCENLLLVKTVAENQEGAIYGFPHDIIQKLAYQQMDAGERSKIYYRIAEAMAESVDTRLGENSKLVIAGYLLQADRSLLRENKTGQWLDVLYEAGIAAKYGTAPEMALQIFECCADLLCGYEPQEKSGFLFHVQLELGECQFVCGQAEEAKQRFELLLAKYPAKETQIEIKRKYINLCACNGDFEKVIEIGVQLLAHLDFQLDPKHLLPDLIQCRLWLGNKKISRLEAAPPIMDERMLCILETLTLMLPSANRMNDRLSAAISLKLALLSARHGNSDYAPIAYAAYCYVLFHVVKNRQKGKKLLEATLALTAGCENAEAKSIAYCILGSLVHHWVNPLESTVHCLAQSIAEGERAGTSLYGSYAIAFTIITKYVMGIPLGELWQYIDDCRKKQNRLEHYLTSCIYDIYATHILQLRDGPASGGKSAPGETREYRYKELFADTLSLNRDMIKLQLLYLEGKFSEAWRMVREIEPKVDLHDGFVLNVEFLFYNILVRLAAYRDMSEPEKRRNRRQINKHLHALQDWVSVYPGNHYARYLLAQAEYDAVFIPDKASDKLYREAMAFARQQGNLPLEALANLLAAKYHLGDEKLSRFYALEAVSLYQKWGAHYIGELILREMKLPSAETAAVKEPDSCLDEAENEKNSVHDILFHLAETEKMSDDEGYLYLLGVLTEQMEVDYCAVFLEKSDEMFLKYNKRKGDAACVYPEGVNLNHLSGLPHKLIRYVARTETEILWDRKTVDSFSWNESYLTEQENLSLACLPIRYSGVFIGIIYLEKNSGGNLVDGVLPFVKGFIPSLLTRQTSVREMNIPSVLKPQLENSIFTERELEVLRLLAEGMSNAEISKALYITLGTVSNHLRNIFAKLEVDNRMKAVLKAKELKIIQI